MNLGYVADMFIQISGRQDLMSAESSAALGTSFLESPITAVGFINSGLDFLELLKPKERHYCTFLANGETLFLIPHIRIIKSIEIGSPDWALLDNQYYRIEPISNFPDLEGLEFSPETAKFFDLYYQAEVVQYTGIRLSYPIPTGLGVRIDGYFKIPPLQKKSDTNWWIYHYPMLVVWAAMYELEVSYRNMEGANAWRQSIAEKIAFIDADDAESSANQPMNYRW